MSSLLCCYIWFILWVSYWSFCNKDKKILFSFQRFYIKIYKYTWGIWNLIDFLKIRQKVRFRSLIRIFKVQWPICTMAQKYFWTVETEIAQCECKKVKSLLIDWLENRTVQVIMNCLKTEHIPSSMHIVASLKELESYMYIPKQRKFYLLWTKSTSVYQELFKKPHENS